MAVSDLLTEGHTIQLVSTGSEDCGAICINNVVLHHSHADYMQAMLDNKGDFVRKTEIRKKVMSAGCKCARHHAQLAMTFCNAYVRTLKGDGT